MDASSITPSSPDFSEALGVPFRNPPSGETPNAIRLGVSRLREISDRREKLANGEVILNEMLYLAECPEDFATIAKLIAEVRAELTQLGG